MDAERRRKTAYFTGGIDAVFWVLEMGEQAHKIDSTAMSFVPGANKLFRRGFVGYFLGVAVLGIIYLSTPPDQFNANILIGALVMAALMILGYQIFLIRRIALLLRAREIDLPSNASILFSMFIGMYGLRSLQEGLDSVAT
jgi:hypothetical protein